MTALKWCGQSQKAFISVGRTARAAISITLRVSHSAFTTRTKLKQAIDGGKAYLCC